MAGKGFFGWLAGWVSKGFAALGRTFERTSAFLSGVAPGIPTSTVAEAFRVAEKQISLEPEITATPADTPWPTNLMTEEKHGSPRRYLVTFEVKVSYPNQKITTMEERNVYFMDHHSKREYEALYLAEFMDAGERESGIIKGARAVNVSHYAGWSY